MFLVSLLLLFIHFVLGTANKLLHIFCSKDVGKLSELCGIILGDPGPDDPNSGCLIHPAQHTTHMVPKL